jgi:glutamyl-tRNA reductase
VPTISSLRHKVESIREQEMEKALSRLGKDFAENPGSSWHAGWLRRSIAWHMLRNAWLKGI